MVDSFLRSDATMQPALTPANNLSELANTATARTNLGVAYGNQTIWVPAAAMKSQNTNGPTGPNDTETTTNKVQMFGLDFAFGSTLYAQFMVALPKSWDQTTLAAIFWWYQTAAGAGAVQWGIDAVSLPSNTTADAAFGTAVTTVSAGGTSGNVYKSSQTSGLTVAGTLSANGLIIFRAQRQFAGGDTLNATARLLGITLLYNTNANNDS